MTPVAPGHRDAAADPSGSPGSLPAPFDEAVEVDADGSPVRVLVRRAGRGAPLVIAAHGITANAVAFSPLATALAGTATIAALDLRGRGDSAGHPGPFGLAAHAADVWRVADALGADTAVLAGHSMGAYVVARAAHLAPTRTRHLVLLDGGLPLTDAPPDDPDAVLEATIGPALARLEMSWPDLDAVLDFWRAHPALGDHEAWDERLVAYVRHDVGEAVDGRLRSRASAAAIRRDGRDVLLDPDATGAAATTTVPTTLVRAARGLLGDPDSPLIPAATRERFRRLRPDATVVELPGHLNHYTMLWDDAGIEAIAAAIKRVLAA